jgi:hypothetical protein
MGPLHDLEVERVQLALQRLVTSLLDRKPARRVGLVCLQDRRLAVRRAIAVQL